MAAYELFHVIADPASAQVRRFIVEQHLEAKVSFRNLTYPEAKADFEARGGRNAPALWDGEVLVEGADAILGVLKQR